MNKYKCFFRHKSINIDANTSYEAHKLAAEKLKVRKNQRHLISVVLCEKGDKQIVHSTSSI